MKIWWSQYNLLSKVCVHVFHSDYYYVQPTTFEGFFSTENPSDWVLQFHPADYITTMKIYLAPFPSSSPIIPVIMRIIADKSDVEIAKISPTNHYLSSLSFNCTTLDLLCLIAFPAKSLHWLVHAIFLLQFFPRYPRSEKVQRFTHHTTLPTLEVIPSY